MNRIHEYFQNYPSQEQVATLMLKQGLCVKDGKAYSGSIEQSDTAIARAAGVDRRVVRSTIVAISKIPELSIFFSKLQSMLLLADAAKEIGCSTIEVVPTDARVPGVMAGIMNVLSSAGINIRQAVVSDPQNLTSSHLILVADGEIPGDIVADVRKCIGVDSVIIR